MFQMPQLNSGENMAEFEELLNDYVEKGMVSPAAASAGACLL
jgi:hypothetical protein